MMPDALLVRRLILKFVSIRQHTSAYVSIRQHTSAYVSIWQHTSAYVIKLLVRRVILKFNTVIVVCLNITTQNFHFVAGTPYYRATLLRVFCAK
jgi:hypothetical protein